MHAHVASNQGKYHRKISILFTLKSMITWLDGTYGGRLGTVWQHNTLQLDTEYYHLKHLKYMYS